MTATLQWIGEKFPPHGALAAEGLGKLLGRPSLDALTVLVRETAQNSWDARLLKSTVELSFDGFTFDDRQRYALAEHVFADLPPEGLPLAESVGKTNLTALVISDRGTVGLGGPTRADKPTDGPTDYIDLLMNVGVGGHEFGGGTYGFGKAITYVVSRAWTIIVHSRSASGLGAPETRLIASGIGDSFDHQNRRYTGRHWWGRDEDGAPEPLTGRAAENLAREIGFPGFDHADMGTSIMIIDPDFGDREPAQAMRFLADAITWNLWPKMVRANGRAPMRFSVSWDDDPIAVSQPHDVPPLHGYVAALDALRQHDEPFRRDDGLEVMDIRAKRPNRRLGRLSLYTFVTRTRPSARFFSGSETEEFELADAAPFSGNSHHVALLRVPELVVKYTEGPEATDSSLEWCGVFICDRDLDSAFAASEPPTHDDWQPNLVAEKRDRTLVTVALREIKSIIRSRAGLSGDGGRRPGATSVAQVADNLAGLVTGLPGTGGSPRPRPRVTVPSPHVLRPSVTDAVCQPVLVEGRRLSRLDFALIAPTPARVRIHLRAGVATNDGTGIENNPPAGSATPSLVRIERPVRVDLGGFSSAEFTTAVPSRSEWTVLATSPDDVMVAFDVRVDRAAEERPA